MEMTNKHPYFLGQKAGVALLKPQGQILLTICLCKQQLYITLP